MTKSRNNLRNWRKNARKDPPPLKLRRANAKAPSKITNNMKSHITITVLLIASFSNVFSLDLPEQLKAQRSHQGFHLEFGIGPAFGSIEAENENASSENEASFSGTGLAMDLHVGHSISKNIVLTAHVCSKYIYTPQIEYNGVTGISTADYTIREMGFGAGATWYQMPADLYAGLTLGMGGFDFKNNSGDQTFSEEGGFSWQVRAGKHWWISDTWGITIGATYGSTVGTLSIDDPLVDRPPFDLESSRFAIQVGLGIR